MDLNPQHQFNVDEFVEQLTTKKLSYFLPGTSHHYSNTGYAILSRIISRVYSFRAKTPKTYADYLNDYIVGEKAKVPLKSIQFPILASDSALPTPFAKGTVRGPKKETSEISSYNMSGQVGEGNGYGTMSDLNKWIRSLMKGKNVLLSTTINLMQTDESPGCKKYGLGCLHIDNLGYGHDGTRVGNMSLMMYDPICDISIIVYLPLLDFSNGMTSLMDCYHALYDTAWATREALGYPKPDDK